MHKLNIIIDELYKYFCQCDDPSDQQVDNIRRVYSVSFIYIFFPWLERVKENTPHGVLFVA